MNWEATFAWIGAGTTVLLPIAALGLWLGKTYIDKWLSRRFQGELDALKHAQTQEIERLRAKIAGMLDRATKLHQHEFEVLPKAWDLLSQALGSASRITASFREGVDPGAMSREDLEVLLRDGPLEEHQKQAVRDASRFEKPTIYSRFIEAYEFNRASEEADRFHNYVIQFGIFIEPSIREKLSTAALELRKALRTWKHILQMPEVKPWPVTQAQGHVSAASDLSREIDTMITVRLWSAAKLDA